MKAIAYLAASFLILQSSGCNESKPAEKPQTPAPIPYQRFVPVSTPQANMSGVPWTGFFALDTKTGQLCLTTNLDPPEKFNNLPNCNTLRTTVPD
jgi:hypothetical protein